MDTYFSYTPLIRDNIRVNGLNSLFQSILHGETSHCPMYNIEKGAEDNYAIVVAVPGFQEIDLNITFQNNQLTILGKRQLQQNNECLHRGIDIAPFELNFKLSNYMQVVGSELNNGLLRVQLKYELPEEAKPRMIPINNNNKLATKVIEDKSRKKAN